MALVRRRGALRTMSIVGLWVPHCLARSPPLCLGSCLQVWHVSKKKNELEDLMGLTCVESSFHT